MAHHHEQNIRAMLQQYRDHLVASDANGCASLYAEQGVAMPQNSQTQAGKESVRKWYMQCFQVIALNVEFKIEEIVIASEEYGFARTTSAGTQKHLASGKISQERNQELFVMQKVGSDWKIARYCFCTINPPSQA